MKSADGWSVLFGLGWRELETAFVLEFPDEGGEFPGDGDDAFHIPDTACSKAAVAFAEAVLHAPVDPGTQNIIVPLANPEIARD